MLLLLLLLLDEHASMCEMIALCMFGCVRVFRYLCLLVGTKMSVVVVGVVAIEFFKAFFLFFCFGEWTLPAWHGEGRLL